MKCLLALAVLALALVASGDARADYLEIRRDAWLKRTAEGDGDQLEKLSPGALVELTHSEQENGYYRVRTRGGTLGFVYRTLVRRHPGTIPPAAAPDTGGGTPPTPQPVAPQPAGGSGIRIATFNIQNFGKTKMGKADIVSQLIAIVRSYPLVAVQEISDKPNKVPGQFLTKLNEDGATYQMLVSPRTGREPSDQGGAQEQYAFYFDSAVIEALSAGELFDDAQHDFFQREPYAARFRVRAGTFTFVLITIHTDPDIIQEIRRLDDAVTWARTRFPGEDDFIVLGDFNAGCDYAKPEQLDEFEIRNLDNYTWLVPDDADTNVAPSACAYDRIVATAGTEAGFINWGVNRAFSDKAVSDHFPVWAEFRATE